MKSIYRFLEEKYEISPFLLEKADETQEELQNAFDKREEIMAFNQYKVLHAMQRAGLSDTHFNWTTGYGYDDRGREKTEEIYSTVFGGQDAIVRPGIANGTHALTLCLQGVLRPGDHLVTITSKPYDTLGSVIGIVESRLSLLNLGVSYTQVEFDSEGGLDYEAISEALQGKQGFVMVYIQRSKGYSRRPSLTIAEMEKAIAFVKGECPQAFVMVDNCYGEFLEEKEPTEVGADLLAGSLIKNPGGGIALGGGYVCGTKEAVEWVAQRLTSPGIGKECGLTFGTTRTVLQGLFLAPMVVNNALKGAMFCAGLMKKLGYPVFPGEQEERSDIIQSVGFRSKEEVIAFCKGVQQAAPVDSFVTPEPWPMPGYTCDVIMAAGAFVQGSSIELSADAPIREPYTVYFQGGLTFEHSKLGVLCGLREVLKLKKQKSF